MALHFESDRVSRRELLGGMAAGGAVWLSGCGGDGDGSDGSGENGGGGSESEEWEGAYAFVADLNPTEMNWLSPATPLRTLLYPPGQTVGPDGEFVSHLVESIEVGPEATTVRLVGDASWSNGEPMLGEDLGKFLELRRIMGPDPARVESGEVVPADWRHAWTGFEWDGRELVIESVPRLRDLATPFDVRSYLNSEVGRRSRFYYSGMWSTYQEEYANPWESEQRHEEAASWVVSTLNNPVVLNDNLRQSENVVSSGPWKLELVSSDDLRLVPHEGYPGMPGLTNFSKLRVVPAAHIDRASAVMRAGDGDAFQPKLGASGFFLKRGAVEQFPESVRQFDAAVSGGRGLILNHARDEVLADRRVRAAFMHLFDRGRLAENAREFGFKPVGIPGLDPAPADGTYYSEDVVSGLLDYERDFEEAARLLRAADFRKEGETWLKPDGSEFELPIMIVQSAQQDAPAPLMAQDLESRFLEFGISAQMVPLEQTSASQNFRNGEFTVAFDPWGASITTHRPYNRGATRYASAVGFRFNQRQQMGMFQPALSDLIESSDAISVIDPEDPENSGLRVGSLEPLKQFTVEAPPVGEPDGSLQEYPVVYLAARAVSNLGWGDAETDRQEALDTLLWVYNYDLPYLEISMEVPKMYHDVADWAIPAPDSPFWRSTTPIGGTAGIETALLHGEITAKEA